ncbi:MAG: hypothetical protein FWG75_09525 [Cystobacterineae bacterium]|nr:hypothetical protein [Cystobacterineae bacterium]
MKKTQVKNHAHLKGEAPLTLGGFLMLCRLMLLWMGSSLRFALDHLFAARFFCVVSFASSFALSLVASFAMALWPSAQAQTSADALLQPASENAPAHRLQQLSADIRIQTRALAKLERGRDRKLYKGLSSLREARRVYAESHPRIIELKRRLREMGEDTPRMAALRREMVLLEEEYRNANDGNPPLLVDDKAFVFSPREKLYMAADKLMHLVFIRLQELLY